MIEDLVDRLVSLQSDGSGEIPKGNFSSSRYHKIFPIVREEDNVYFVSWILQLLKRNEERFSAQELSKVRNLITAGESSIDLYRNRYGDKTYNFYRPNAWFPGGRFLSKFVRFQPTDDSDDTSIAMRGKSHDRLYAEEIKSSYIQQSNGLRNRWIKRTPKVYRELKAYNTWIGSEGLFVDFDLVVMCNILVFNAEYDLGIGEQEKESIAYIIKSVEENDFVKRPWAISCWYPKLEVIVYAIADVLATGYYPVLDQIKESIVSMSKKKIELALEHHANGQRKIMIEDVLLNIAIHKMTGEELIELPLDTLGLISDYEKFSFGVIPLTHPFDGTFAQYLGSRDLFRMYYHCEAQVVSILLEYFLLSPDRMKSLSYA